MPLEITGNYLSRCTPDSAVPEITVPEGVKTIGYRAFERTLGYHKTLFQPSFDRVILVLEFLVFVEGK